MGVLVPRNLEILLDKIFGHAVNAAIVDSNNNAAQGEGNAGRGNTTNEHEDNVVGGNVNERKLCNSIIVKTISFLTVSLITFLVIAYILLANGDPRMRKLTVQYVQTSFLIKNETTVTLEGIVTLLASFEEQRNIYVHPGITGTYSLTTKVIKHYPISTFSTSPFHIINKEDVVLKFDEYETHVPSEGVRVFYRKLHYSKKIWLALRGNIKMRLSLNKYIAFPYIYKNLDFTCNIRYKAFTSGKIIYERCA